MYYKRIFLYLCVEGAESSLFFFLSSVTVSILSLFSWCESWSWTCITTTLKTNNWANSSNISITIFNILIKFHSRTNQWPYHHIGQRSKTGLILLKLCLFPYNLTNSRRKSKLIDRKTWHVMGQFHDRACNFDVYAISHVIHHGQNVMKIGIPFLCHWLNRPIYNVNLYAFLIMFSLLHDEIWFKSVKYYMQGIY